MHSALIPLGVLGCLGFILLSEVFIVSVCDSESCLFLSKLWGVLADSELFLVLANPLFSAPEIKHKFEITEEEAHYQFVVLMRIIVCSTSVRVTSVSQALDPKDIFIRSFSIYWIFESFNPPLTYFSTNKALEITILKIGHNPSKTLGNSLEHIKCEIVKLFPKPPPH